MPVVACNDEYYLEGIWIASDIGGASDLIQLAPEYADEPGQCVWVFTQYVQPLDGPTPLEF